MFECFTMPFSHEDKILIKHYRLEKKYGRKRFMKEFPNRGWTLGGLRKLIKKIDQTGDIERQKGSGRPRSVRTEENIEKVEALILSQEDDPGNHLSQHEIARETGINRSSVERIAKLDLGLTAYKKNKVHKLSDSDKEKRVVRSKKLLRYMTHARLSKTFFTDEKIFKCQAPRNTQNDRVYAVNKNDINNERLNIEREAYPGYVMISVGISKIGKTSIHFVDPGAKVNSQYYCNDLLSNMLPEMDALSHGDYVLMQDGARSHTSKYTLEYISNHCPNLIKPHFWPPKSPDLNPCDYFLWDVLETNVWKTKVTSIQHLKQRILEEWEIFPQDMISNAIDAFRKRLHKCVELNGGHIERYI